MADPTDQITGTRLQRITDGTVSVDDAPVVVIDTAGTEKVELTNKGPNTVYFRTDGTDPTPGAAGNADQLASGSKVTLDGGKIIDVELINAAGETSTVFYRLYS